MGGATLAKGRDAVGARPGGPAAWCGADGTDHPPPYAPPPPPPVPLPLKEPLPNDGPRLGGCTPPVGCPPNPTPVDAAIDAEDCDVDAP